MMAKDKYTHAIRVDTTTCIGCSHCMKVCPTQAIRIADGHANIRPERCVDCGECYRVCPVDAIYVQDDEMKIMEDFDYRVALIPSVFIGQFPAEFTTSRILQAVHQLGFHEVFEVEHAVDLLKEEYSRQSENTDSLRPRISSYCPAIVRLIQVVFPSLTEHILQLKAPHDIAANYCKAKIQNEQSDVSNPGVFYITPCASKIVAAKAPEGENESPIDGVFNMNTLYNKVYQILVNDDNNQCKKQFADLSPDSVSWSFSGYERKYFNGRALAIDGMENVLEFLEKLESGQISEIDFLELRACDQGCAGGILCPGNRFLTVERLESRQNRLNVLLELNKELNNPLMDSAAELSKNLSIDPILPRSEMLIDKDMDIALRKMDRLKTIAAYLPGFDCGACGAPTCRSLAEDIVKNNASMSHCVFVQRIMEKNYKLSPEQAFQMIEKIWGKNRLNKYVDKNGNINT